MILEFEQSEEFSGVSREAARIIKETVNLVDYYSSRGVFPPETEIKNVYTACEKLREKVNELGRHSTATELLHLKEIKRITSLIQKEIKIRMAEKPYSFQDITSMHDVPLDDIKALEGWLQENLPKVKEYTEKDFKKFKAEEPRYNLGLRFTMPKYIKIIDNISKYSNKRYSKYLGKLIAKKLNLGSISDKIEVEPSYRERSFYLQDTDTTGISIPDIFKVNGKRDLILKECDLIELLGHELWGHAVHDLLTEESKIPAFLRVEGMAWNRPLHESLAEHFENIIFNNLAYEYGIQKKLKIKDRFPEIFEEHKSREIASNYQEKLSLFTIHTMSREDIDMKTKKEIIRKFALDPKYVHNWVNNSGNFGRDGKIIPDLAYKLVYSARPVQKSLKRMEKVLGKEFYHNNRKEVDRTMLTGYWTSDGFLDKMNFYIGSKKKLRT